MKEGKVIEIHFPG